MYLMCLNLNKARDGRDGMDGIDGGGWRELVDLNPAR